MPRRDERRARYWLCTLSAARDWEPALPDGVRYIKGQQEVGEGGYRHWQFYVVLAQAQRFSTVVSLLPESTHIEPTRSAAAEDYVWKEDTAVHGTRFEFGDRPVRGRTQTDWERVRLQAQQGDFGAIDDAVYIRYRRALHDIHVAAQVVADQEKTVKVFWGEPGTGKSHRAFQEARAQGAEKVYVKDPVTKWWDGYDPTKHEYVVVDEFEGGWSLGHFLRWTDKWASDVEIKGGRLPFKAKAIWFTSNKSPDDWYPMATESQRGAVRRRIDVTHFSVPFRRLVFSHVEV